jgi:hypothetical protein
MKLEVTVFIVGGTMSKFIAKGGESADEIIRSIMEHGYTISYRNSEGKNRKTYYPSHQIACIDIVETLE